MAAKTRADQSQQSDLPRINTRIIQIDPRKIKLLEVNARFMRHETFMRLVDNVKSDGALTSIPFGWHVHDDTTKEPLFDDDGEPIWEVLSGNHRVKAAVSAGIPQIDFMITTDYLTPDRRRALQLSHNAIAGEDDPATLKIIYESIGDVDMRVYSGLDDKTLKLLENISVTSLSEANLSFQTVSLTFLPEEAEIVEQTFDEAKKAIKGSKVARLASMADYDTTMDALEAAAGAAGVKNVATALMLIMAVFMDHVTELSDQYLDELGEPVDEKRTVPLMTIFGDEDIPSKTAAEIKKLIKALRSKGKIEHDWQVLDYLLTERHKD